MYPSVIIVWSVDDCLQIVQGIFAFQTSFPSHLTSHTDVHPYFYHTTIFFPSQINLFITHYSFSIFFKHPHVGEDSNSLLQGTNFWRVSGTPAQAGGTANSKSFGPFCVFSALTSVVACQHYEVGLTAAGGCQLLLLDWGISLIVKGKKKGNRLIVLHTTEEKSSLSWFVCRRVWWHFCWSSNLCEVIVKREVCGFRR